jgi:hypothetical protein
MKCTKWRLIDFNVRGYFHQSMNSESSTSPLPSASTCPMMASSSSSVLPGPETAIFGC